MTGTFARRAALIVGALAVIAPSQARADIVFSNLGSGNTYNSGSANPVGFDFFTGDQDAQANSFFVLFNTTLSSITIPLKAILPTNASPVTVALRSSVSGLPGSVLESWTIPALTLPTFGAGGGLTQLTSLLHPSMLTGVQYWVTVFGGASDPVAWNFAGLVDANPTATSVNGGATWNKLGLTPGAVRLDGTVAPEPTTLVLTATAFLGILLTVRKRRAAGAGQSAHG
jgi:hypothetical protein